MAYGDQEESLGQRKMFKKSALWGFIRLDLYFEANFAEIGSVHPIEILKKYDLPYKSMYFRIL